MGGRILHLIAFSALALGGAGCRDAALPSIGAPGDSIWVEQPALNLNVGEAAQLRPMVIRRDGRRAEGGRLLFRSSAPEVAAVDSSGRVVALSSGSVDVIVSLARLRTVVRVQVPWSELAELTLQTPGGEIIADLWAIQPIYVHFSARTASGASVCGKVPLSFQIDSAIAEAVYAPLLDDPCLIRIVPRSPGRTRLTVTAPGVSTAAEVQVTNRRLWGGFERIGGSPEVPAVVGTLVHYRIAALDETGRPVTSLVLYLRGDGDTRSSPVTTDSAGTAEVDWYLPTWRASATLRAVLADGTVVAEVTQALKTPLGWRWLVEREDAPRGERTLAGTTARYRFTARDELGNPVVGVPIRLSTWGGSVFPANALTDSAGTVPVSWTLPTSILQLYYPRHYIINDTDDLTLRWQAPDGSEGGLSERIDLRPVRPAGLALFRQREIIDRLGTHCGMERVYGDTVDLRNPNPVTPYFYSVPCPKNLRLAVGVIDRYGNPVVIGPSGISVNPDVHVVLTAEFPEAINEEGWCECGGVSRWYVQKYRIDTTAESPWAAGMKVTLRVAEDPSIPPRTVSVIPVVQ